MKSNVNELGALVTQTALMNCEEFLKDHRHFTIRSKVLGFFDLLNFIEAIVIYDRVYFVEGVPEYAPRSKLVGSLTADGVLSKIYPMSSGRRWRFYEPRWRRSKTMWTDASPRSSSVRLNDSII